MSLEQREIVGDVTKWIMRIGITLCSFLLYSTYSEVKTDLHEIKTSVQTLESRMIRIEYELKLK
jgi:hypothetical protein